MMSPEDIRASRISVVTEAKTWENTPYHHMGKVKGSGVDCATLLVCVYTACDVVKPFNLGYYPPDWNLHRSSERYIAHLLNHTEEVAGPPERIPLPGDIVLWKFGRTYAHGAIVSDWPMVIHSYSKGNCQPVNVERAKYLTHIGEGGADHGKPRPMKVYVPKAWLD